MKDDNYEFHVGDKVETIDGMVGKIVSICRCERCAERGFFEPRWETSDGKDSDYITVNQVNWGFPYYRRIGKYVWNHDADEEKSKKNIFIKENVKMKEIKLTIDGKEVQLTDEQLRLLGIGVEEKKKNPFDRVLKSDYYYYIDAFDEIHGFSDNGGRDDDEFFNCVNYFNDKQFAYQVALHQQLYRKLLKFAYDNGCEDTAEWNKTNYHYYISYSIDERRFYTNVTGSFKHEDVWFCSRDSAKRAIKEVVEPFMKEHPNFVW